MTLYYRTIQDIKGPIVIAGHMMDAHINELVYIEGKESLRRGQVLEVRGDMAVIQVYEGTQNLGIEDSKIRLTGSPYMLEVDESMAGRIFNGSGFPIDGGSVLASETQLSVTGSIINPARRIPPSRFIETGISVLDAMNSLVAGQKLPIFSGSGLPHNELAAQIARCAQLEDLVVIFAGIGLTYEESAFFRQRILDEKTVERTILFLNMLDDPVIERLLTPRVAMTTAEYFAYELDRDVLVILSDMHNYCDALREVSTSRNEIPGRKGYPGYMYTDLATIYERCGVIKGKKGSVTLVPVLTIPNDDITHPIADLTGYITEGQIMMSRDLFVKGIRPPIDVLPSLSRLMKDAIGEGKTVSAHRRIADQLYNLYSKAIKVRNLAAVIGEDALAKEESAYLKFGERFEDEFINQKDQEHRSLDQTFGIIWDILSDFNTSELTFIPRDVLAAHHKPENEETH
jgi:V/A-type H+-transporting ATPase subunit B